MRGMQALPALPESLSIIEMGGQEGSDNEPRTLGALYLNIGLQVSSSFEYILMNCIKFFGLSLCMF